MDTVSDNPLKRFSAFWLGMLLIGAFGLLALVAAPFLRGGGEDSVEAAAASERLATLGEMEEAQGTMLKVAPESVFDQVGGELLSVAPGAVRDNAQIVPGSVRAIAQQSAPSEVVSVEENDPGMAIPPAVMEAGQTAFLLCSACHGPTGDGVPMLAPPLKGSEWLAGPVANIIRIQLRGLSGPITVNGTKYELAAPMVAQAFQTDEQIAAVLTYARNSWGNKGPLVTPDQVEALRGEVGKPALTVKDLVPPSADHPDYK